MSALAFSFTKIVVQDLERAERFYCDVFGMKPGHRVRTEAHDYALEEVMLSLGEGGNSLVLVRYLKRPCPPSGAAWVGFVVADVAASVAAIEKAGGRIEVPVRENTEHGVIVGILTDPEGHVIEVIERLEKG